MPEHLHREANALLDELGHLPLAITQASAFMIEKKVTISEYLDLFRRADSSPDEVLSKTFQDPRRDCQSENSVMTIMMLSLDHIKKKSPRSAAILSTMANLDRSGIPVPLLYRDGESQVQFREALGVLKAFSLVLADEEGANFQIHPLVQLSTHRWLQINGQDSLYAQETLMIVSEKFPSTEMMRIEAVTTWDLCKKLLPHALRVEMIEPTSEKAKLAKARLQMKIGEYELVQGRTGHSILWHRRAAQGFSDIKNIDVDNQVTTEFSASQNLSDLAMALSMAGFNEESERLHHQAIVGTEKLLGKDHPLTMAMLLRRVLNLNFERRFRESSRLCYGIYDTRITLLGKDHPDTLDTLSCWTTALEWLGKFEECESLGRRAVNGMRRCLPPHHPMLYFATSRLSAILQKLGKTKEAEALARETVRSRLEIYGSESPMLPWSVRVLSLALRDQGKLDEAFKYSKQAFEITENVMGRLHIITLIAIVNLAFLQYGSGRYKEPRFCMKTVSRGCRKNMAHGTLL